MNSRGLAGPVADRVADQVLKNLLQMEFVDANAGRAVRLMEAPLSSMAVSRFASALSRI